MAARGLQLGKRFEAEFYTSPSVSQLDTLFLSSHLLMTAVRHAGGRGRRAEPRCRERAPPARRPPTRARAGRQVHKRILVTSREQRVFEAAIMLLAATLLLKAFFVHRFNRWRPGIVLCMHLGFTTLRALAVHTMASKQATHVRVSLSGNMESPLVLLASMLGVLGGPFRAFEMLGLRQGFPAHAVVSAYYLLLHTALAADGCRMAYSFAMFYLVHQVHDAMAGLVDAALEAIVPLPGGGLATCSSCAGVVVYCTLMLFGSLCVPLYMVHVNERAARRRFAHSVRAQAAAQAAAAAAAAGQPVLRDWLDERGAGQLEQQQRPPWELLASEQQGQQQEQQQQVQGGGLAVADGRSSVLVAWSVHALMLLAMFLLSWLCATVLALEVLPRVLSPAALDRWCPNRPLTPFVIAGQVHG
ncbi:hypothetical protein HT031_004293 [Scenedesmus sp. PABB004]|nr:hypothetical protein HT031_004293 [Scenedesmus sp. PABB004]